MHYAQYCVDSTLYHLASSGPLGHDSTGLLGCVVVSVPGCWQWIIWVLWATWWTLHRLDIDFTNKKTILAMIGWYQKTQCTTSHCTWVPTDKTPGLQTPHILIKSSTHGIGCGLAFGPSG